MEIKNIGVILLDSKRFHKFVKNQPMFTAKQTTLMEKQPDSKVANSFVKEGLKSGSTTTALGNGALKYTTTGNDFVDQFGKISNYRAPRSYAHVDQDMRLLWSQDPELTMRFVLYIRLITRTVQFADGTRTSTTQRGQGLKNEGIFRMLWIAINYPEVFARNVALFIAAGSWKDIIQMMSLDLQYHKWEGKKLDWNFLGQVIVAGLENKNTVNLVKKYLPNIKASSKCTTLESQADTIIGKYLSKCLFGNKEGHSNYKKYRRLKSSGTAHEWQKLISQKKLLNINFNTIHGRALSLLVSGKFLKNNGLESQYENWLATKPTAKYTGYVYELLAPVKKGYQNNSNLKKYQIDTINKQFTMLIEVARKGMKTDSNYIVVGDTSSSMTSAVTGLKVSAYDVMKSLALYFSALLKGHFSDTWIEFNTTATLHRWKGSTPVEKLWNDRSESYGSTNFVGVAKLFADIKRRGVPESDFPTGIICLSDGCFNSLGRNNHRTNTQEFRAILLKAGFSMEFVANFKIVLWDIPNSYYGKSQTAFEDFADCPNLYYMSGFDGSAIAFLTGVEGKTSTPKNAEELFMAAMDQELFGQISL
jgi:hypothetical protein